MLAIILITFVDLFVAIFEVLLVLRVVLSYFVKPGNGFYAGLISLTEPLLAPLRRFLPAIAGADLAPLVMFFVLQVVQYFVHSLFGA